jgi:hypothetical protein
VVASKVLAPQEDMLLRWLGERFLGSKTRPDAARAFLLLFREASGV